MSALSKPDPPARRIGELSRADCACISLLSGRDPLDASLPSGSRFLLTWTMRWPLPFSRLS